MCIVEVVYKAPTIPTTLSFVLLPTNALSYRKCIASTSMFWAAGRKTMTGSSAWRVCSWQREILETRFKQFDGDALTRMWVRGRRHICRFEILGPSRYGSAWISSQSHPNRWMLLALESWAYINYRLPFFASLLITLRILASPKPLSKPDMSALRLSEMDANWNDVHCALLQGNKKEIHGLRLAVFWKFKVPARISHDCVGLRALKTGSRRRWWREIWVSSTTRNLNCRRRWLYNPLLPFLVSLHQHPNVSISSKNRLQASHVRPAPVQKVKDIYVMTLRSSGLRELHNARPCVWIWVCSKISGPIPRGRKHRSSAEATRNVSLEGI